MAVVIPFPTTVRYCPVCGRHTTHEIRQEEGPEVFFCARCEDRRIGYELDRD
ncbi:MAG TPA: hypothetical protein VJ732_20250 [Bryobacteraceae bacterium]|nr:hypothetical protein [Bryobacteraceae bacterium]